MDKILAYRKKFHHEFLSFIFPYSALILLIQAFQFTVSLGYKLPILWFIVFFAFITYKTESILYIRSLSPKDIESRFNMIMLILRALITSVLTGVLIVPIINLWFDLLSTLLLTGIGGLISIIIEIVVFAHHCGNLDKWELQDHIKSKRQEYIDDRDWSELKI